MRKWPLLVILLTSACSVGPDYKAPTIAFPEHWPWEDTEEKVDSRKEEVSTVAADWWKQFNDPTLIALEEEGIRANGDILNAAERVNEARALLSNRQADFYPSIGLQGNATRTSNSRESTFGSFPTSSKPYNNFGLAAVLDYEVDVWGRLRRASESARAQLLAVEANRDAVRIAVASDIANGYFTLRALDAQIAVTEHTIKARSETAHYQESQYRYGAVNGLTANQSVAELAAAQAQLPLLQQARTEQMSALGVLLGRDPKTLLEGTLATESGIDALPVPPLPRSDIPADLLRRRPDIAAAEQTLIAANADIGAAIADYFPRVTLGALIGLSSAESEHLFQGSARNWQAGATLAGPLIDFGRAASNVETARSRERQALIAYQQTVRIAFKEVLDAMSAVNTAQSRVQAQAAQVDARAQAFKLAQLRYDAGYSTYLDLLDAQRFLFQAQLEHIDAERSRLIASVNLYKALGGGWK